MAVHLPGHGRTPAISQPCMLSGFEKSIAAPVKRPHLASPFLQERVDGVRIEPGNPSFRAVCLRRPVAVRMNCHVSVLQQTNEAFGDDDIPVGVLRGWQHSLGERRQASRDGKVERQIVRERGHVENGQKKPEQPPPS